MLELHQFRHSAFCLKVRLALEVKGLNYQIFEVTPGIGQIAIFQISGQRQLPVLVDGEKVIADSSTIISYLEKKNPSPKLISDDPKEAAQIHLIEDWADNTLAKSSRAVLIQSAALDPELRKFLLPEDLPDSFRKLIGKVPCGLFTNISELISQREREELLISLEHLSKLVQSTPWLVGNNMSFADLAVAAHLSLLRFPNSSGDLLAGKGCPGFSDHPKLQPLFEWRDKLIISLMNTDSKTI